MNVKSSFRNGIKISDEEKALILKMYEAGDGVKKIATLLGRSSAGVRGFLKIAGVYRVVMLYNINYSPSAKTSTIHLIGYDQMPEWAAQYGNRVVLGMSA